MSLGAMVAVAWANAHPQELARCVLINASLRPFSPFASACALPATCRCSASRCRGQGARAGRNHPSPDQPPALWRRRSTGRLGRAAQGPSGQPQKCSAPAMGRGALPGAGRGLPPRCCCWPAGATGWCTQAAPRRWRPPGAASSGFTRVPGTICHSTTGRGFVAQVRHWIDGAKRHERW